MKKFVITVDSGTTNTRAFLWDNHRNLIAMEKAEVGARSTAINGNNAELKQAVHDCIERLLIKGGIGFEQVDRVIACGMITSEIGLVEIPHVYAPVGKRELAAQCKSYLLEDVCPLPIIFIPGMKNNIEKIGMDNIEAMDTMRGEEVESIAMLEQLPTEIPYLLVLPGSHTKFISVDRQGRLTASLTTITGELLSCITTGTVIANAVGRQFVDEKDYDKEMVLKGFETSYRTGMGRAAFSARMLNMFVEKNKVKLANYILGVALASDVQSIHHSIALETDPETVVVVSGKNPLRQALVDVLQFDGTFAQVKEFVPDMDFPLSAMGACLITDSVVNVDQ